MDGSVVRGITKTAILLALVRAPVDVALVRRTIVGAQQVAISQR